MVAVDLDPEVAAVGSTYIAEYPSSAMSQAVGPVERKSGAVIRFLCVNVDSSFRKRLLSEERDEARAGFSG